MFNVATLPLPVTVHSSPNSSMQFLLLFFVILTISTTTNTHHVLEHTDSCFSTVQITVPYTVWVGTNVTADFSTSVTVPQYTTFYNVMDRAESQSPEQYR
jgi:hypothetical protein